MQACEPGGAMASIQASEDEVLPLVQERVGKVDIAGINGPRQTVISGDETAVGAIVAYFDAANRKTTRLTVSHAFHSVHMNAMLEDFRAIAETCDYSAPNIPVVSNVTGVLAQNDDLVTADYWVRHVRSAVRFLDGMQTLRDAGATQFLECGPKGVLCAMGAGCLPELSSAFVPSMRKQGDEPKNLAAAMGRIYTAGMNLQWDSLFENLNTQLILLPTYAFQRKRYWLDPKPKATLAPTRWIGNKRPDGQGGWIFEQSLSTTRMPLLNEHRLGEAVILSSTMVMDLLSQAASTLMDGSAQVLDLKFEKSIGLVRGEEMATQIRLNPRDDESWEAHFSLMDRGEYRPYSRAVVQRGPESMDCESLEAVQARCADAVDVNETMQTSAAAGYALACFAQLQAGWRGASEVLFKLSAPKVAADARGWAQLRDMADAIPFAGGAVVDTPADAISVPTVFGDCTIVGEPGVEVWVHAIQRDGGEVAVHLYGEDQSPFAAVTGMSFQVLDPKMVAPAPRPTPQVAAPVVAPSSSSLLEPYCAKDGAVVLAGDLSSLTEYAVQELLTEPGRQVILVPAPKVAANVQAVFSRMSGGRTQVATSADSLRGLSNGSALNPYFGWSRVPRTTVNGLQISNCFGNCTRPPVRGVVQNSQFSCRTNGVDRWMAPVCSSMNWRGIGRRPYFHFIKLGCPLWRRKRRFKLKRWPCLCRQRLRTHPARQPRKKIFWIWFVIRWLRCWIRT